MNEAEQAVVGAVLLNNDAWWRVSGLCSPADFSDPNLAAIWRAMDRVSAEGFPLDVVTLSEQDESLDLGLLARLAANTPSAVNAESYARIVRSAAEKRKARSILSEALSGNLDIAEVIGKLDGLSSAGSDITLAEAVASGIATAEHSRDTGFPTGIPSLDRWIHLTGGKLVIVAARPSIGKTAMVWQWLLHGGTRKQPSGLVSLEMGASELGIRAISNRAQIDSLDLSRGRSEAISHAKRVKLDLPVRLDFRATDLPAIVSRITEWKHRHQIEIAAVDYLQLIDAKGENRNAEIGSITRTLKRLAMRLQIPIIVLCQFNRALEKTGRQPMLVDLRDSGEIEQDADIVLALHSELSEKPRRDVQLGILKNRGGRVGWLTERVEFEGAYQSFRELVA